MVENQAFVSQTPVGVSKRFLGKADKFSYWLILALVFLAPVFFIPNPSFSIQAGKVFIVALITLLAFSFWIFRCLKTGRIKIPQGLVFCSALAVLFISAVSTLFSGAVKESFIGLGVESGTLFFVLVLFLVLFTSFKVINSSLRAVRLMNVFFVSFLILLTFQLLRVVFGTDFLNFGLLNTSTATILGRWNDIALISGLAILLLFLHKQVAPKVEISKFIFWPLVALSFLALIVVNSLFVWVSLAIASLVLIAHSYFVFDNKNVSNKYRRHISKKGIFLLVVSVVFIVLRPQVGTFVSEKLSLSQAEVRPSFAGTLSVAKNSLKESPGFGAGPNRFSIEWGKHKPVSVNNTIFWDTGFNSGVGFVPTTLVTNGVLGLIAWLSFIGGILFLGTKALFLKISDKNSRFVLLSSFFATVYLWVFSVLSAPGITSLSLTFLFSGIFLAALSREGLVKQKNLSFAENSKYGFISVFVLMLLLVLSASLIYASATRYLSLAYSQKALIEANINADLEGGFKYLGKAISLAKTDNNYRLLSQAHVANLGVLLRDQELAGTEEGRQKFQEILGSAIFAAQQATKVDEDDFRNWMTLGNIYESIISLKIEGAYENAKATYERAGVANPTNPSVDLALARIEVLSGNNDRARVLINKSLQKKNNYTGAIFLLSQIEINEGNIGEAVKAVEAASVIEPNNSLTFFQLGFLKYTEKDNDGAIKALERAIVLNPNYSNAKYFLGLAYFEAGRLEDSIAQFVGVEKLNPENVEVKKILENLRSGLTPLRDITPNEGEIDPLPVEES